MKKISFYTLITVISVFTFSCKKNSTLHVVKYTIQGAPGSNVTYTDQDGIIRSVNNVDASWTAGFSSDHHGLALKLTVVSNDGTGNVGGKIFIDDKQTAKSNGNESSIAILATLP